MRSTIYVPSANRYYELGVDPEGRGYGLSFDYDKCELRYKGSCPFPGPYYIFNSCFIVNGRPLLEGDIVTYEGIQYYVKFYDGSFCLFPYNTNDETAIILLNSEIADELISTSERVPPKLYPILFDVYQKRGTANKRSTF